MARQPSGGVAAPAARLAWCHWARPCRRRSAVAVVVNDPGLVSKALALASRASPTLDEQGVEGLEHWGLGVGGLSD